MSFEIDRFMFMPSFGTDPSHDRAGHRGSSFMCTSLGVKVSKWVRGVVIGCLPRKRFLTWRFVEDMEHVSRCVPFSQHLSAVQEYKVFL